MKIDKALPRNQMFQVCRSSANTTAPLAGLCHARGHIGRIALSLESAKAAFFQFRIFFDVF